MKKNILAAFMVSFLALILLSACNDNSNNVGDAEDPTDSEFALTNEDATVLTFWTFGDSHAEYFHYAQRIWNEQNPDRQIELDISVQPFGAMHENLLMALESGTGAPDLVDVEVTRSEMFLNTPHVPFLPQNDALEPFMDHLIYSRVAAYSAGGNYFGVCYHVGSVVMFVNKSLFEQADLDWNDIVTWDDFVEMGQLMVERTGAHMIQVEGSNIWALEAMIAQQGEDVTIDGRPNIATEEAIRALILLQDMVYEYEIARVMPGLHIDSEEFYAEINTNNFATLIAPAWYMGRYLNLAPDQEGNIAIAPLPVFEAGNNRSSSAGGTMTAVTNQINPDHAELALDFVAFAKASYEMALAQWTLLGFDPVRTDVLQSDAVREPSPALEFFGEEIFDVLYDIADETKGVRVNAENAFSVRDHIIVNVLPNVIVESAQDAQTALEEAQEILESQLN